MMQRGFLWLRFFPSFCHRCQSVGIPRKVFEMRLLTFHFSSVKYDTKTKQPTKGNKRPGETLTNTKTTMNIKIDTLVQDPLRRISDMLLRSMTKRHANKFDVPAGPVSSETPLTSRSSQDLVHIIYHIPKDSPLKTEKLGSIEKILTKRLYKMPLNLILHACHGFYIQKHNSFLFVSQMLSIVEETFHSLTPAPDEITRLMLYVFIHGNAPSILFYRVEEYLLQHLEKFDINDLGVICMGFFLGKSRLSSQDLLDAVAVKLLHDLHNLDTFLLLGFLKMFRHAGYIRVSFYEQLADLIVNNNLLSRFRTVNPVMHIAFTYASLSIKHTLLFKALLARFEDLLTDQKTFRTKDISKFVWACGSLQFMPEKFDERFRKLASIFQVNSLDNIRYPESCAELLMGLTYLGIFPEDLLSHCLSFSSASKLIGDGDEKEKRIQMLLLNESVKAECPNYKGNILSQNQVTEIIQHPSAQRNIEHELQRRVGLLAVLASLQHSLGPDKVHCLYPLLHFKTPVIELRYCPEAGFLTFSSPESTATLEPSRTFTQTIISDQLLSALSHRSVLKSATTSSNTISYKRVIILVTGRSQYALNDPDHVLGHLSTMKRQLSKAGCTLIEVNPENAVKLELSSHKERCHQLSKLLSTSLSASICLT